MNDKQKILVMIGIGSLFIFIIGAFVIESTADNLFDRFVPKKGYVPNWITLTSAFFFIVSITGFFLFKDRTYFNWTAINWSKVKSTIFDYFMVLIGIGFAFGGFLSFGSGISLLAFILAFFILYKTNRNFKNN